MRLLRFAAFAVILLAVYLAQYIFDHRSLIDLFPLWLLDRAPFLYQFTRWLPEDLLNLATFLFVLCSIGFGLLSTQWLGDGESTRSSDNHFSRVQPPIARSMGLSSGAILVFLAFVNSLFVAVQVFMGRAETLLLQFGWLLGLLLYLLGVVLLERREWSNRKERYGGIDDGKEMPHPEAGWPVFLLILFLATLLFGWQLTEIPVRIDEVTVTHGLQAISIADGTESALFRAGSTGLPLLAYVPAAVWMRLVGDGLLGVRLASLFSGLLLVTATWLLACELFRRVPRFGYMQTVLEDDGRWIAYLAAALIIVGHVAIHYSRTPIYVAPVAWGTIGLWALLRGLRTRDRFSLAISGLSIGVASTIYASGLIFLMIIPIWWLGVWLVERTEYPYNKWVPHGRASVLIWFGGLFVWVAPIVATWLRSAQVFLQYLQSDTYFTAATLAAEGVSIPSAFDSIFLENLRRTLLTFNLLPNGDLLFDYPGPFLNTLLAPIFILSIGALLLNLDRLPGWLLLSWFGIAAMVGSLGTSTPFWPRLLPLLPFVALATAFGFDRMRLMVLESAGTWLEHTSTYLIVGVVIWAGVQSWLQYYDYSFTRGDSVSYMARAIRQLPLDDPIFLLNGSDQTADMWSIPVIDFVIGSSRGNTMRGELSLADNPIELPPHSHIVIQASEYTQLGQIQQRYPNGVVSIQRNLHSDPMLYIYSLSGE